jgi:hypothetical protein
MSRLFTIEEAEALLPQLSPLVAELQDLKRKHDQLQKTAGTLGRRSQTNGHAITDDLQRANAQLASTALAMNDLVEKVGAFGCEVKDLNLGLLDFRAMRDGAEIYLCWKAGETKIEWWHELTSGFSSRKPLP